MRKIRRMLISLLAAAISAAALPVFANQPAAPVFVSPSFYGREALSALNNGERLVSAYDKITAGMGNTENIYEDPPVRPIIKSARILQMKNYQRRSSRQCLMLTEETTPSIFGMTQSMEACFGFSETE